MIRSFLLGCVIGAALWISAWLLWGHDPGVAEGPFLRRSVGACVCREVRS